MSNFRKDPLSCEGCPLAEISCADCLYTSKEDCQEVEVWLDEHDKQIRAKALDEFVKFVNTMPIVENECGEKRPMTIEEMANRLKEY